MLNIEELWHELVGKLENLRHHVDPALHKDLDTIGQHAATLKAAAEGEVTKVATDTSKFVGAETKTVEEDALKAVQTPDGAYGIPQAQGPTEALK